MNPEALLRRMFAAAVDAADPARVVPPHLPAPPAGRTVVVGAGKAAAAMAAAVEAHWPADRPLSGVVVTRHGHNAPGLRRIRVLEASHPVPNDLSEAAARAALQAVKGLQPTDLVLALFSGGGSALMALPAPGLTLADKQHLTRVLLRSGASIGDINCIRRHLSAVKGGRLAAACPPAQLVSLLISDVPGDNPADIASGPTVPDPSTVDEAAAVLRAHAGAIPETLRRHLCETPKAGDPVFARARHRIVAAAQPSLAAAAAVARRAGVNPCILGDAIEGEAREVARTLAGIAIACSRHGTPAEAPCVLISGGETTVTIRGGGRGGRNAEFLLSLAISLAGRPGIWALAADTDGLDGTEDNAGAILQPDTLARGPDAKSFLEKNDAYAYFAALDDLIVTGPTRTNVNDFRAILILPSRATQ